MQHFILATLAVPLLFLVLEQTCAIPLEMFMGPVDANVFYVEEGGSKDIECWVLGDEDLTINLTWSGPSVNASKTQKLSINPRGERQRVGNWLNITKFSDAIAGEHKCRAKTSRDDLSRHITIAKSCEVGKFHPPGCTKSCSDHCKPGPEGVQERNCDHINGTCLYGCLEGYIGSMCTDCEIGKFDPSSSCTKSCSENCKPDEAKGRSCDQINGTCLYNCLNGYTGPMCTVKPDALTTAGIAGIVIGAVIFVVLVAFFTYRKCCIGKKKELKEQPVKISVNYSSNAADVIESQPLNISNTTENVAGERGDTGRGTRVEESAEPQPPPEPQGLHTPPPALVNRDDRNGNSPQNSHEEVTPLMADTSTEVKSVTEDVVDSGQGARPKQVTKRQPRQESPASTRSNNSGRVPNEWMEVAEVPGAMASPPRTALKEELQELKRELEENRKQKEMFGEKVLAEKDERIKYLEKQLERERDCVKELKEQLRDKEKELRDKEKETNKMLEKIENLQLLRMEASDDSTRETLEAAEKQAAKGLSRGKNEVEELRQQLKETEDKLEAMRQKHEDQDRRIPAESRQLTAAASNHTSRSSSNTDLGVINKGDTGGPSQPDEYEVIPDNERYMQDHV